MQTSKEVASSVITKVSKITQDDIARAMAGVGSSQDISPEDVEEYAGERSKSLGKEHGITGGIAGGILGALTGPLVGMAAAKRKGLGALAGLLGGSALGAGAVGGLSYLGGKSKGRSRGRYFGGLAQEGKLPAYLPEHIPTKEFEGYATGTQPGLSEDLSPEDYRTMRRELASEGFTSGLLEGASSGLGDIQRMAAMGELSGPGAMRRAVTPIAEGLAQAESKRQDAVQLSKRLLDLYHRGYGHLAERIRSSV